MSKGQTSHVATSDMLLKWQGLARDLVSDRLTTGSPRQASAGELLILGSGFAHVDLMLNDEQALRSADSVFHCLYDRVTQIWINEIRPDAFDLRILYDPHIDRHATYICMAEAMLHEVRRGRRVVAVYYGHPGIFATPTHRAIQIARREGHKAVMRPGISALDYLVADVGFDPMIPGLLSYEASDLLLRTRRLDPTLHTVLWQVGVVGEFSYAPSGFENRGFESLVAKLAQTYGEDGEVVHYIAPQYVGVEPLIDRHAIGSLLAPDVRSRINAMSTFYIPPRDVTRTDAGVAADLGFPAGLGPKEGPEKRFDLAAYGSYEEQALQRFRGFSVDPSYTMPGPSPAAAFMLEVSREPGLLARFLADPSHVLSEPRFAALSDRARELLAIPHPLAINAAIAEPPACIPP